MLKSTGVVRKLDELGRFVVPLEARKALGMLGKGEFEVLVDLEQEQVVLQKVNTASHAT